MLIDVRCLMCNALLFQASGDFTGSVQIECQRCGAFNKMRVWAGRYLGLVVPESAKSKMTKLAKSQRHS